MLVAAVDYAAVMSALRVTSWQPAIHQGIGTELLLTSAGMETQSMARHEVITDCDDLLHFGSTCAA